jgi:hypothetical protein
LDRRRQTNKAGETLEMEKAAVKIRSADRRRSLLSGASMGAQRIQPFVKARR